MHHHRLEAKLYMHDNMLCQPWLSREPSPTTRAPRSANNRSVLAYPVCQADRPRTCSTIARTQNVSHAQAWHHWVKADLERVTHQNAQVAPHRNACTTLLRLRATGQSNSKKIIDSLPTKCRTFAAPTFAVWLNPQSSNTNWGQCRDSSSGNTCNPHERVKVKGSFESRRLITNPLWSADDVVTSVHEYVFRPERAKDRFCIQNIFQTGSCIVHVTLTNQEAKPAVRMEVAEDANVTVRRRFAATLLTHVVRC